jgi:hypothetical protein
VLHPCLSLAALSHISLQMVLQQQLLLVQILV